MRIDKKGIKTKLQDGDKVSFNLRHGVVNFNRGQTTLTFRGKNSFQLTRMKKINRTLAHRIMVLIAETNGLKATGVSINPSNDCLNYDLHDQ